MRRYEVVIVLAPTLTDEELQQNVESFQEAAVEKGAQIIKVDQWGKKRLAYPINKHNEGFYVILTVEETAARAALELERRFKVSDQVIRFLTVRVDLAGKRADKFRARRRRRRRERSSAESGSSSGDRPEAVTARE